MQLFLKVNGKYFYKINTQLDIYTYIWKICRQSAQRISPHLCKASQTASPVYPVSVGVCWSYSCTLLSHSSSCSDPTSPWLIRKGGECGPAYPTSHALSLPTLPLIQLMLLLPLFSLFLVLAVISWCTITDHTSLHQWRDSGVSISPAGDGALARTESSGGYFERELKSGGKAHLRLCCWMSAHGKPGFVGSAACRLVPWNSGDEFSLWLSCAEAEEH